MNELVEYLDNGGDPNAYVSVPGRDCKESLLKKHRFDLDCFRLLLERGADPNQPLEDHWFFVWFATPIVHFVGHGLLEQAKLLIEYGADVNVCSHMQENLFHINKCGELVPILVNRGVDINKEFTPVSSEPAWAKTPIQVAIEYEEFGDVLEPLMRYRPQMNGYTKRRLKRKCPELYRRWIRGKWSIVKSCVKLLSLHARAVVTANHPLRKLARSEFNV